MARVPYVSPDDLDAEHRDLVVSSLQPGKRINIYSAVANNPAVLAGLRAFLGALWADSGLTDRQRELVILTAASEVSNAYEWHQHVHIATDVGIDPDELAALARDDRSAFSADEDVLVAYARAVVRGRVTDELHAATVDALGEAATVGAAATTAGYLALGRLIDALGVELEADDEFVGWDPA